MAGGDYGRIRHTFWTDPDIKRGLSIEQKALLLYYFTSPHSSLVGLYYCPFGYVAVETGIPVEKVREWTLGALAKYVTYDEATDEILVHRAGRHQVGDELKVKDHRVKAIHKAINETHSARLIAAFLELYRHWDLGLSKPEPEAPSKPLASPFEAKAVAVAVAEHIQSKPEPLQGATGDDLGAYADANSYGPKDRLIAVGEDISAWRTPTGDLVPQSERLRCLKLADAHLAEPDSKAKTRRNALAYVIAQQFDPFTIQKAADRPQREQVAQGPVNQPSSTATTDLERMKAEHPEIYAEELASFERTNWWAEWPEESKAKDLRLAIRERLNGARPRIVA